MEDKKQGKTPVSKTPKATTPPVKKAETSSAAKPAEKKVVGRPFPKKAEAAKPAPAVKLAPAVKPATSPAAQPAEKKVIGRPFQKKTEEVKPATVEKPAEIKPAEVKPEEVKPVTAEKPEEKLADVKPAEVKPEEAKETKEVKNEEVKSEKHGKHDVKEEKEKKAEADVSVAPIPVHAKVEDELFSVVNSDTETLEDYKSRRKQEKRLEEIQGRREREEFEKERKEDRAEMSETRKRQKDKKLKKRGRMRFLKNFFIWLLGVIFGALPIIAAALLVFVIPIGTILGIAGLGGKSKEYISDEIAAQTIFSAAKGITSYTVGDIPVLDKAINELASSSGIGNYLSIDTTAVKDAKIGDMFKDVTKCIKIKSTALDGIGLSGLSIFKTVEVTDQTVDPAADGFNPKVFYYLVSGVAGEESAVYARAFNDDKTLVDALAGTPIGDITFYYPDASMIDLNELLSIIGEEFMRMPAREIVSKFTDIPAGSLLDDVLGDLTIRNMGSINADNVKFNTIIPYSGNQKVYDVIYSALKDSAYGSENPKPAEADMRMKDLKNIDVNGIKVSSFMTASENPELFKILRDGLNLAADGSEDGKITVGSLSSLSVGDIKLSSVVSASDNAKMFEIIYSGITSSGEYVKPDSKEEMKINDLSHFNFADIVLINVLPKAENKELYDILSDVYGAENVDTVTVGQIATFDVTDVKLGTVLPRDDNEDLYDILDDAIVFDINKIPVDDRSKYTSPNPDTEDIYIGHVNKLFQVKKVNLNRILDNDTAKEIKLWSIIRQGTNKPTGDVRIEDLSSFDIGNITLKTVVDTEPTNPILKKLWSDDVHVTDIGTEINDLKVNEVYVHECFTSTVNGVEYAYNSATGVYTKQAGGGHYVKSDAGVWLFIFYTPGATDSEGYATSYTLKDLTFGNLEAEMTDVAGIVMETTVRQLTTAGVITVSGLDDDVAKLTPQEIIDTLNTYWYLIP